MKPINLLILLTGSIISFAGLFLLSTYVRNTDIAIRTYEEKLKLPARGTSNVLLESTDSAYELVPPTYYIILGVSLLHGGGHLLYSYYRRTSIKGTDKRNATP